MKNSLLFFVLFVVSVISTPTTCDVTSVTLTVNQEMPTITCSGYSNMIAFPTLPEGLSMVNNVITGKPVKPQMITEYLIVPNVRFDSDIAVRITIAVIGTCSYVSYGFDEMKIYQNLLMEPFAPRSDCHFTSFSITPALPNGMSINPINGEITGTPTDIVPIRTYTVIASSQGQNYQTTFQLQVISQNEMTLPGLVGCYYTSMSGCMTPTHLWYLTHDAAICQREIDINFSDEYSSSTGGHAWPGLDDRFRDFLSAMYTGYIIIPQSGEYTFKLLSDDGSSLYIDNLDVAVVDNSGCHGDKTVEGKTTLTAGKHVIMITYFDMNFGSKLTAYYKADALGIAETIISQSNTRVGGRGPAFLKYSSITGVANSMIHTGYPVFASGITTEWTSQPALPTGLTIDTRGVITGTVATAVSGTYTITMSGPLGKTQGTVKITIVNTPAPGVIGSYYKITDNGSICSYPGFGELILDLRVKRVDADINHPDLNGDAVWDGLPQDMSDRFYVEWEGFVYFDTVGTWELGGQSDDGWKLYINNELVHESWLCQGMNRRMVTYTISKPGYYSFKILYFEDIYGNGILFEWKRPLGTTVEVIPSQFFFHTPKSALSYSYTRMHLYKNAAITPVNPIWFSAVSSGVYTVSPALPSGLTLDPSTGIISGTPSASQVWTSYIITNGANTAKIYITIAELAPPTNYRYTFNNNAVSPDVPNILTFNTYFEMRPYFTGTMYSWSVTPTPPKGIYVETYSGWFKGTPKESLNAPTAYTITGCNAAGCASVRITIMVPGCQGGHYYFTDLLAGSATLQVKQGETILSSNTGNVGTYQHCFGSGAYTHLVSCTSSGGCAFDLYRDDGLYMLSGTAAPGTEATPGIKETSFSTTISNPSFSLAETTITAYKLQRITPIRFITSSVYTEITVSPAFPSTVSLKLDYGQIEGYWTVEGTYQYVLVMKNPNGASSSVTLSVTVTSCPSDKTLISFERFVRVAGVQESFAIRQNNEVVFLSGATTDYTRYVWSFCLAYSEVEIELFDQYNDGWAPNSYLAVYEENGFLLGKWVMPAIGANEKYIKTISLDYQVRKQSEWKVSLSTPGSSWTSVTYNDASWATAKKDSMPSFTSNAIYLRKTFTIDDRTKYPLFEFSIYMQDGVAIYVNDQIIYKKHLPEYGINGQTLATDQYDSYRYRRASCPSYVLKDGVNQISIEIHRKDTSTVTPQFDFFGQLVQGSCINRIDSFTVTNSGAFNQPFEGPDMAFDNDPDTKWLEDGIPAYVIIKFDYERQDFINRLQLWSGDDAAERDPRKFTFSGSNDNGSTWNKLLDVDQQNLWSSRKQSRDWWITDTLATYNMYKLEVTATQGNIARTQLSEIRLFTCHLVYCLPENGWSSVQSGQVSTKDCDTDSIGEQTRSCSEAALKPVWKSVDTSNCKSSIPPSGNSYVFARLRILGPTIEGMTNSGVSVLQSVISSILNVVVNNVELWLLKDASESTKSAVSIYVRVLVSKDLGDSSTTILLGSLTTIATNLKSGNKNVFPDTTEVTFLKTPTCTKAVSLSGGIIALIVVLSILAVIAVIFIVACVFFRTKKSKTKKLGSTKLNERRNSKSSSEKKEAVRV